MTAKRHGPGPAENPGRAAPRRAPHPGEAPPPEPDDGAEAARDGAAAEEALDPAVVTAFEVELAEALRRAGEAEAEAEANWEKYLRSEAELDNLRKRAERLREDATTRLRRDILTRFLSVGDNLERALSFSDAEPSRVIEGVEATYRELMRLLQREGVASIDALDQPFDPALHEAIGAVTVPGLDGERVVAVEQPGYTLNGELLRPARVIVGQPG